MRDERDRALTAAVEAVRRRHDQARASLLASYPYALLEGHVGRPGGPTLRERRDDPKQAMIDEYRATETALVTAKAARNAYRKAASVARALGPEPRPAA